MERLRPRAPRASLRAARPPGAARPSARPTVSTTVVPPRTFPEASPRAGQRDSTSPPRPTAVFRGHPVPAHVGSCRRAATAASTPSGSGHARRLVVAGGVNRPRVHLRPAHPPPRARFSTARAGSQRRRDHAVGRCSSPTPRATCSPHPRARPRRRPGRREAPDLVRPRSPRPSRRRLRQRRGAGRRRHCSSASSPAAGAARRRGHAGGAARRPRRALCRSPRDRRARAHRLLRHSGSAARQLALTRPCAPRRRQITISGFRLPTTVAGAGELLVVPPFRPSRLDAPELPSRSPRYATLESTRRQAAADSKVAAPEDHAISRAT